MLSAFVNAFRHIKRFDSSKKFFPWFYSILKNLCMNHLTRVRRRREDSIDAGKSTYLTLFPNFVETRTLLGLRWDYHRRQALTLQIANSKSLSDSSYFEYRLQWSGALF